MNLPMKEVESYLNSLSETEREQVIDTACDDFLNHMTGEVTQDVDEEFLKYCLKQYYENGAAGRVQAYPFINCSGRPSSVQRNQHKQKLEKEMNNAKIYALSHPFGGPETNDDEEYEVFKGAGVSSEELVQLAADVSFRLRVVRWCEEEKCHRVAVTEDGQPEGALTPFGHCVGFHVDKNGGGVV